MTALETATGDYAGYGNIITASVERVGGELKLQLSTGDSKGQELLLSPRSVEMERLICTATEVSGLVREGRFEFTNEGVDRFVDLAPGIRLSKSD